MSAEANGTETKAPAKAEEGTKAKEESSPRPKTSTEPKAETNGAKESTAKDPPVKDTPTKDPETKDPPPELKTQQSTGVPLKEQFEAFAKFGDKTADGKTIKLSQSDKWFKQAKVIDGKKITTTDTGIAFRKISKNSPKLSFSDWKKYLEEIGKTKNLEVSELRLKLKECGKPGISGTTAVANSSVMNRLTDTSKYGASHRERFDTAGKGRGKAGRN